MSLQANTVNVGTVAGDHTGDTGQVPFQKMNAAMAELYAVVGAATGAATAAKLTAAINAFTGVLAGLVPASGGGTANFLRADGAFAAPPNTTYTTFTTAAPGLVPISPEATGQFFLRDDGTWSSSLTGGLSVSGGTLTASAVATGRAQTWTATGNTTNGNASLNFDTNGQLFFQQQTASANMYVGGASGTSGSMNLTTAGLNRLTVGGNGVVSVAAPASGTALTATGVAGSAALSLNSSTGANVTGIDANITRAGSTANSGSVARGPSLALNDSTNATSSILQHSGGQTELWQLLSGVYTQVLNVATTRALTLNAPSSGTALTVNGVSGAACASFKTASAGATMQSIFQNTGTTAGSHTALVVSVASGSAGYPYVLFDNAGAIDWYTGINTSAGYQYSIGVGAAPGAADKVTISQAGAMSVVGAIGINGLAPPAQVTGFGTPTGTGVIANFPGATATLAQCSQAIAEIIKDLKAFGLYGA